MRRYPQEVFSRARRRTRARMERMVGGLPRRLRTRGSAWRRRSRSRCHRRTVSGEYQQVQLPQFGHGELVEQRGEESAVGSG